MLKSLLAVIAIALLAAAPLAGQPILLESAQGTTFDVDLYGNVFLLDRKANTLRLFGKDHRLVREIGGSGWGNNQFDSPAAVWARNGIDVFVADFGNHRIQRFDRKLNYVSTLSTRNDPNPDVRFGYPTDVGLSRLGDLYIVDSENARIVKVNRFTRVERTFGGFDAGKGRLRSPTRLEIGPQDYIFVLDRERVVVFDSFGNYLHDLGEGVFSGPADIAADASGIVVADGERVYWFDAAERPVAVISRDSLFESVKGGVRSLATFRGELYVLTDEGLIVVKDPRTAGVDERGK